MPTNGERNCSASPFYTLNILLYRVLAGFERRALAKILMIMLGLYKTLESGIKRRPSVHVRYGGRIRSGTDFLPQSRLYALEGKFWCTK